MSIDHYEEVEVTKIISEPTVSPSSVPPTDEKDADSLRRSATVAVMEGEQAALRKSDGVPETDSSAVCMPHFSFTSPHSLLSSFHLPHGPTFVSSYSPFSFERGNLHSLFSSQRSFLSQVEKTKIESELATLKAQATMSPFSSSSSPTTPSVSSPSSPSTSRPTSRKGSQETPPLPTIVGDVAAVGSEGTKQKSVSPRVADEVMPAAPQAIDSPSGDLEAKESQQSNAVSPAVISVAEKLVGTKEKTSEDVPKEAPAAIDSAKDSENSSKQDASSSDPSPADYTSHVITAAPPSTGSRIAQTASEAKDKSDEEEDEPIAPLPANASPPDPSTFQRRDLKRQNTRLRESAVGRGGLAAPLPKPSREIKKMSTQMRRTFLLPCCSV